MIGSARSRWLPLLAACLLPLASCSSFQNALASAEPLAGPGPPTGPLPDSVLREATWDDKR